MLSEQPKGAKGLKQCKGKPKTFYDCCILVFVCKLCYFSLFLWLDMLCSLCLRMIYVMRLLDLFCRKKCLPQDVVTV